MGTLFYILALSQIASEDEKFDSVHTLSDEDWAKESIRQGNVYDQENFVKAYNNEWIATGDTFIRVLSADYYENTVPNELGMEEEFDGTEGQDRKSYTDDQDRENYIVNT